MSSFSSSTKKEIRYTICPVGNSSYIAANKGWLKEGLAKYGVTPVLLQNLPQERWKVHFDYQDPALFREGGNIPPIWAKSRGAEPVVIGLTFLEQKQYILVRSDSPIDSVEQLRKYKLGLPTRPEFCIDFHKATAQRGFETALTARGVANTTATYIELPVSEAYIAQKADKQSNLGHIEVEALEKGEVDAIFVKSTKVQKLLETGKFKVIFDVSADPRYILPINNEYPNILTVSRQLAEEAPEVVVEYLKQLLLAAEWAKENRIEVLSLFSRQTHGTPGQVASAHSFDFHKRLAPELSEQGLLALESQKRFLYDHGYLEKDFDIEKWTNASFLKAALADIDAKPKISAG